MLAKQLILGNMPLADRCMPVPLTTPVVWGKYFLGMSFANMVYADFTDPYWVCTHILSIFMNWPIRKFKVWVVLMYSAYSYVL